MPTTLSPRAILNAIEFEIKPGQAEPMIEHHGSYRMWMRDSFNPSAPFQLYADRAGEEDDDHPNFVGLDNVVKVATEIASRYGYTVKVWNSEKRYFCVEITPKS